ncbi:MAG: branched-chain amino acid transaminase [Longimicrobiales bacterium]
MSTGLTEAEWIWKDGEFIPWGEAKTHILSLAVQFGSSIFEGIRAYRTGRGAAIFRLGPHIRRLFDSCKIYRMEPLQGMKEMEDACVATVRKNGLNDCYIRPMVVRGYGSAGLNPAASPVETYVCAWPWGTYLGEGALETGVDVCVSSWMRAHPNTFPVQAKAAGHYNAAQLMKMEALANGYVEAIAIGPSGLVSEGSGQNVFLVRDGAILTPFLDGTNLTGITRDSVIHIARDLGYEVNEGQVAREALYTADELFFTGTASEVTPIRSVDKITVGGGKAGPVTMAIQRRFMAIAQGRVPDDRGWLTHVE